MKRARGGFLTIALFALAATLLTFSVVGSSQAALNYYSDTYGAQVSMQDIGVTLLENGNKISWRDYDPENKDFADEADNWEEHTGTLVAQLPAATEGELKIGHRYDEVLTVQNTGTIDEYVRVSVYRYWEKYDPSTGRYEKDPSLDSNLIDLHFTENSGWRKISETEERTVLFYEGILGPTNGESEGGYPTESPAFADTLEIEDEGIEAEVTKQYSTNADGDTVITTIYTYNNARFVLRVDVDAVQTHHAEDAMRSAWGVSYLG